MSGEAGKSKVKVDKTDSSRENMMLYLMVIANPVIKMIVNLSVLRQQETRFKKRKSVSRLNDFLY
jgi:hypothetical protein